MSSSGFLPGPRAIHRRRSSDWWTVAGQTCVAAYQPKGAASLAASYVNLANPGTHDAAPGTAPSFDTATGWTFNGSKYLNTGIVHDKNWSMIVRFSNASGNDNALCGAQSASSNTRLYLAYKLGSLDGIVYGHGLNLRVSPTISSGVIAVAGPNGYRNGTVEPGSAGSWSGINTTSIIIGGNNVAGTPTVLAIATISAIAIYSTTLSAGDVAALTARMAAL